MTMDPSALLDISQGVNIPLLDHVVHTFYQCNGPQQAQARDALETFQKIDDVWIHVDAILNQASFTQTKFIALSILERVIQTKWKLIDPTQHFAIREFIILRIINLSQEPTLAKDDRQLLSKLNLVLVQILKQEWPHNWPNFISELVDSSRSSISLCENNMAILKLLSEEVFDYSTEAMTQMKTKTLKNRMAEECSLVLALCMEVLASSDVHSLLLSTLSTLHRFIKWIPLGFIFDTNLLDLLATKYMNGPVFRNSALKCMTEIVGLDLKEILANNLEAQSMVLVKFTALLTSAMNNLMTAVPLHSTDFESVWNNGEDVDQQFIQNLVLFLTTLLSNHAQMFEQDHQLLQVLIVAHQYIYKISRVDDREVFKVALEFWSGWVKELYEQMINQSRSMSIPSPHNIMHLGTDMTSSCSNGSSPTIRPLRRDVYAQVLSSIRVVCIERMVKPEEVLVVENEDGQIVREAMKEVDTLVLYKSMRDVLVFLTHLDPSDMELIMCQKLQRQIDESEWSWANLNKLCWAVGSISGAMAEDHEKNFLVQVIKELLGLVDMKRGKDNKAVVASNIMYVVGQYPRFLKAHWRFLKTVVKKLFEFMHETHEGVQDMACDTYIKIAQKTKKKFVGQEQGEVRPFIEEIIEQMDDHVRDLSSPQTHVFFEATGTLISAQASLDVQSKLVSALMHTPNQLWDAIMKDAAAGQPVLQDIDRVKSLTHILRLNVSACTSIGGGFKVQMARIFTDMWGLYQAASQAIYACIEMDQQTGFARPIVRSLRSIKKETLKLAEAYVSRATDLEEMSTNMVPHLLEACLSDYARNPANTRDAEVLHVIASITNRLGRFMNQYVQGILSSVFTCTLEMINKELIEFPEHRAGFFKLLDALVTNCFVAVIALPDPVFTSLINSIVWGFNHDMRDVSTRALNIMATVLDNINRANPEVANKFYAEFYLFLLGELFSVMTTKPELKFAFSDQTKVLARLMHAVVSGQVSVPLSGNPSLGNAVFLQDHLSTILTRAFPHINPKATEVFVVGLMELNTNINKFKPHVRDFLIQTKEWVNPGLIDDFYLAERDEELKVLAEEHRLNQLRVPGLVRPADLDDDSD